MKHLTKHEQMVLAAVLLLLTLGWGVKAYRTANPGPISNHAMQSR